MRCLCPVRSARDGAMMPARVAHDDVAHARTLEQRGDGDPGGAGARDHDTQVGQRPTDDRGGVEQPGEHDDRGAVLVVVEHRDVEALLEPGLDVEAARRRDVLEVDAAVGRSQPGDRLDELVDGAGLHAHRHRVDPGEVLEEDRLALHHRHRRERTDVAEAEDGGAVGDRRRRCCAGRCSAAERLGSAAIARQTSATPGRVEQGRGRRGPASGCVACTPSLPPSWARKTGPSKSKLGYDEDADMTGLPGEDGGASDDVGGDGPTSLVWDGDGREVCRARHPRTRPAGRLRLDDVRRATIARVRRPPAPPPAVSSGSAAGRWSPRCTRATCCSPSGAPASAPATSPWCGCPHDATALARPLSVKRLPGRDPDAPERWWLDADNPRDGRDVLRRGVGRRAPTSSRVVLARDCARGPARLRRRHTP